MTIVTEENVSNALEYSGQDPHPIAKARFDLVEAENEDKYTYAIVYSEQTGSIRDKETATDRDQRVLEARHRVADCIFELERHKSRLRHAEMIFEIWRTENANARAAERIR